MMEKRTQHEQLSGAFRMAPDLEYRYRHPSYEDGLQRLEKSLTYGPGIVLMTGGPGTGKTMLFNEFTTRERPDYLLSFQLVGGVEQEDLVQMLAAALQIDESQYDHDALKAQIRERIRLQRYVGRRVLIAIDEAHNFSMRALAFLSALATQNLIWPGSIVIVLFGVEKLEQMLSYPDIAAAGGRIIAKHRLMPMDGEHTRAYVDYRLQVAGIQWFQFRDAALEHIYEQSGGVPRRVNQLCGRAITYALIDSRDYVDAADIVSQSDEVSPAVLDHYLKDSKRAPGHSAARLKDLKQKVASSLAAHRTERKKTEALDLDIDDLDTERPILVEQGEGSQAKYRVNEYKSTRKRTLELGLLSAIVGFFLYHLFVDSSYQDRASDWLSAQIDTYYRDASRQPASQPASQPTPRPIPDTSSELQLAEAESSATSHTDDEPGQADQWAGAQIATSESQAEQDDSQTRLVDAGDLPKGAPPEMPPSVAENQMQALPAADRIAADNNVAEQQTDSAAAQPQTDTLSGQVDTAPPRLALPSPLPSQTDITGDDTAKAETTTAPDNLAQITTAQGQTSQNTSNSASASDNEVTTQITQVKKQTNPPPAARAAVTSDVDRGVIQSSGRWVMSPDLEQALRQQTISVQRLNDGRLRLQLDVAEVPLLAAPAAQRPVTDLDRIAYVLRNFHGFDTNVVATRQTGQGQLISDFLVQQGLARVKVHVTAAPIERGQTGDFAPVLLLSPSR